MQDLIERLEKATGPDARLDAEIVAALNDALLKPYPPATDFGPHDKWQFWSLDGAHFLGSEGRFKVLPYTASIDAAMTLIPDNCGLVLWAPIGKPPSASFEVDGVWLDYSQGNTKPLALCIAALKAREQSK